MSVLEKLWKSNRDKFVNDIPDKEIIQAYLAIRNGNNHQMSELIRLTMEKIEYKMMITGLLAGVAKTMVVSMLSERVLPGRMGSSEKMDKEFMWDFNNYHISAF